MKRSSSSGRAIAAALTMIAMLAICSSVLAEGLTTTDPNLPPDGVYLTADDVHTKYNIPGVIEVLLEKPEHKPIAQEAQRKLVGADEIETFPSSLIGTGVVTIPPALDHVPTTFQAFGPVETIVFGKAGNVTGTFDTEMLSMSLSGTSGVGPFMIRESPTLPSKGRTSITDLGGGQYRIDSFFDVFTELSIDGGQTWIPSDGPAHMNLVPEPATIVMLLGMGLLGAVLGCVRRLRRGKAA